MGSEVLIYAYGLVCLSILVFNLIYSVVLRGKGRRDARRTGRMAEAVAPALSGTVPEGYAGRMEARLRNVKDLLALDEYLLTLTADTAGGYIGRISDVFPALAEHYQGRDDTVCACFAHFVQHWGQYMGGARGRLSQTVSQYVRRNSLYCRINALKALCALGDADLLLEALIYLAGRTDEDFLVDDKIIVELLLGFRGDSREFIAMIWDNLGRFREREQRALLDYIRFKSGDYGDRMLDILKDPERGKELRLSAIRYFARYPDGRARPALLDFVSDRDPANWEYAAVAASALAEYPGEDSIDALSGAMHSPNWYVRSNSAESLEKLGFGYEGLTGRAAGSDRYAREMLTYNLEKRRLRPEHEAEKEAAKV